jgi:gas vesicle protein
MTFKKIFILSIGIVMTIGVLAPIFTFAENSIADQQGNVLCDKISNVYSKIAQAIGQRESKLGLKKTDIINKIQDHWADQDSSLADKRQKWDTNRNNQIAKLKEKFPNDPEKQAVLDFEQAVDEAIFTRRAAIDSAISNFRQRVEELKNSRHSKIEAAKATFKSSVVSAFEKAKSDCLSGVPIATIREELKNSLAAYKEKYNQDVQEIEKIGAGMDQLIDAKKAAFEKAIQDFKTAMEKARADFKASASQEDPDNSLKQACESSGGTVATSTCCQSAKNFPNLCLIGPCGCSPDNSHQIKVCDCGNGKCFNGSACVAGQ